MTDNMNEKLDSIVHKILNEEFPNKEDKIAEIENTIKTITFIKCLICKEVINVDIDRFKLDFLCECKIRENNKIIQATIVEQNKNKSIKEKVDSLKGMYLDQAHKVLEQMFLDLDERITKLESNINREKHDR